MYGPSIQHVDVALAKSIPVAEHGHFVFRAEMFNVLNSVIFANPVGGITNAQFGNINAVQAGYQPREVQFALRYEF